MARFSLFFEANYIELATAWKAGGGFDCNKRVRADILIAPKGIIKVDNSLGEYYSNIPLAHTHMPSISRTDKQNTDFTSTALHLFYLENTFILFHFKYYRAIAQIENITLALG